MSNDMIVLHPDAKGHFDLPCARADIKQIDIADVDLVLTTKAGVHYLLAGAGMAAMSDAPPEVDFRDGGITADQLLTQVGAVTDTASAITAPSSLTATGTNTNLTPPEQSHHTSDSDSQVSSLTTNTEATVEQLVQAADQIDQDIHSHDYDYIPPQEFQPPPEAVQPPAGVPPPVSLTPLVNLFMGNVVGTTTSTTVNPGYTTYYGGGGAVGSDATAQLGPRDALQFSAATITGNNSNDIIYADGPSVGNTGSAVTNNDFYTKQFILNVAGYFTSLNNITISNVPTNLSIVGAMNDGGGVWTLPSSYVLQGIPFTIVYGTNVTPGTFQIDVNIAGVVARGVTFNSTQVIEFQYADVTSVSQVTDPSLVYDANGLSKEIYVLPLLDQPNIISTGNGDDIVYGSPSNDTITLGNGNDQVSEGNGTDVITLGIGTNTISIGNGSDTVVTGNGSNTLTINGGTTGTDNITLGTDTTNTAANTIYVNAAAGATGNYNIMLYGSGTQTVAAQNGYNADGNFVIALNGTGFLDAALGAGTDTVTTTGNGATISAGTTTDTGAHTVYINSMAGSTGLYTITLHGTGAQTVAYQAGASGDGDYNINMSEVGVHKVSIGNSTSNGNGTSTFDTTINVGSGTNTIATGNGEHSITAGTGVANITTGGGADQITVAGGGGTINAGAGNNTITINSATGSANTYNLTTTGAGTDAITGGDDNYTVTMGSGANVVTLGAGTDIITTTGNSAAISAGTIADTGAHTVYIDSTTGNTGLYTVTLDGTGTQTLTYGSGASNDGDYNINMSGSGVHNITLGNSTSNDNGTSAFDTTINVGSGTNTISAGNGEHSITAGAGVANITTGSGADAITVAGGGGTINVGDGNNHIAINSTAGSTDTYNLTTTGTGTNAIAGGDDNYNVTMGDGANTVTLGNGTINFTGGNGGNAVSVGDGTVDIVTGSANDNITTTGGGGLINVGTGNNAITVNSPAGNTNTLTIVGGEKLDTVVLNVSQDYYIGNAQFSLAIDGFSLGTYTINGGIKSLGQSESITITGYFGALSAQAVAIDFLNDAYGGTSTTDRNMYVNSITWNGVTTTENTEQGSDGTVTYNITAGTYTSELTGNNTVTGGAGNYNIAFGDGNNTITLGNGSDYILVGNGNNNVTLAAGSDTLHFGSGTDVLHIGGTNDRIYLGTGNDTVTSTAGGTNYYVMNTNTGVDNIVAGGGQNTLDFSTITTSGLTINLAAGTATGTNVDDTFSQVYEIIGNNLGNTVDLGSAQAVVYAGSGNNTIVGTSLTTATNDLIYGGAGNNTYLSPDAGTTYNGTNAQNLTAIANNTAYTFTNASATNPFANATNTPSNVHTSYVGGVETVTLTLNTQINDVNYGSTSTTGLTINLATGVGIGGNAAGSVYAFTPTTGYSSINEIISNDGTSVLTPSYSNSVLVGGSGTNNFMDNGTTLASQTNILIGNNTATGSGTENYYMGLASEVVVGSTHNGNALLYQYSQAGIVVNLDAVSHTFSSSAFSALTVAAYTGANWGSDANGTGTGTTGANASSYSTGDYYVPVSGIATNITQLNTPNYYDSVVYGGTTYLNYFAPVGSGNSVGYFYAGSGGSIYAMNYGYAVADVLTAGGTNVFNVNTGYNMYVVLNPALDTGPQGTKDTSVSLTYAGTTYAGFAYGWNDVTTPTGNPLTYISGYENVLANAGNDYIVGDNNGNQINAESGSNTIILGDGHNIITAIQGSNAISSATGHTIGVNTLNFETTNDATSGIMGGYSGSGSNTSVEAFLTYSSSSVATTFFGTGGDEAAFFGSSALAAAYEARTGTSNFAYSSIETGIISVINGSDYASGTVNSAIAVSSASASTNATFVVDNVYAGASSIIGHAGADIFIDSIGTAAESFNGSADTSNVYYASSSQIADLTIVGSSAHLNILRVEGWGDTTLGTSGNAFGTTDPFSTTKITGVTEIDVRSGIDSVNTSTNTVTLGGNSTANTLSSHPVFELSSTDIQNIVGTASTPTLILKLDSGEIFTPTGTVSTSTPSAGVTNYYNSATQNSSTLIASDTHTAANYYSDVITYTSTNHATVQVHYGAG